MKTRITELFGIEHPIIQGGMHYVGFAELAAAVSNAGGLGIITGLTQRTPELLAKEIAALPRDDRQALRREPDLPAGGARRPTTRATSSAIIDGGVKIVETAGNNPQKWLPALHEAGIKVIHKCTSVRHALKAEAIGCDAVSVDGFECGGHPGEDDVPNFILLPRAAEELKIPFVASRRHGRRPLAGGGAGARRRGHEHGHALHRDQGGAGARERQAGHRRRQRTRHAAGHAPAAQHRARAEQRRRRARCSRRNARSAPALKFEDIIARGRRRLPEDHAARATMDAGAWSAAWSPA